MTNEERKTARWASALLGTALTLVVYYCAERIASGVLHPGPDPATVAVPGPSDYLKRIAVCGLLVPVLVPALYFVGARRELQLWSVVQRALVPVLILATLASVLMP